jgi:hypothetical protein
VYENSANTEPSGWKGCCLKESWEVLATAAGTSDVVVAVADWIIGNTGWLG